MSSIRMTGTKRFVLMILSLVTVISAVALSAAVFTDRVNRTGTIQVCTFTDDGYTITREAPDGYFTAGETVKALLKESNTKSEDIKSQITMTVSWDSPVPGIYPWGNASSGNAVITLDGSPITYQVNGDKTITFTLPEKLLRAGASNQESTLSFQIPQDLPTTGRLHFNFDRIDLLQHPSGWQTTYDNVSLDTLDYGIGVVWNISKNPTTALGEPNRDVIAFLTSGAQSGEYGLEIIRNGSSGNTNAGKMQDWAAAGKTPWADFTITSLNIGSNVTTIGDYAFAGETGITSVTLPNTITHIGTSAFDGSGLSGELTIPASVKVIESLGFGNLPNVHTITFEHTSNTLTLPDNESSGSTNKGAFYVPSYVETTVNSTVEELKYGYMWFNDNRRTAPMLNASYSWRSTSDGAGNYVENIALYDDTIQRITLMDYYMPDGTELKSWDASDPSVPGTVIAYICADGTSLILAGNGYGRIYTNPDSYGAFRDFRVLTTFENSTLLDTSKTTDMSYMFGYCSNLGGLDVSHFDTSNVTTLAGMFYEGYQLPELAVSEFDTGNVTNMLGVFTSCRSLTELDVTKWDTRKVTTMMYMFNGCSGLTELDLLTREVKVDASTSYIAWDTSSVANMARMFINCTKLKTLKVSTFDTSSVTTMQGMFEECTALPALDLRQQACSANSGAYQSWDTSSATNISTMFKDCSGLKTINVTGFDTSNVQDMAEMFAGCTSLQTLDVSNFNTAQCMEWYSFAGLYRFASNCPSLTQIILGPTFGQANTAHSPGSSHGMFYVGDPYTVEAPLGTMVTGANGIMLAYDWSKDHRGYTIAVTPVTGGSMTVTPVAAIPGQTITLSTSAATGYEYSGATVQYSEGGAPKTMVLGSSISTFVMPAVDDKTSGADVIITPSWKQIVPILAAQENWYTQSGKSIAKSSVTSIVIQDDPYTPGSGAITWDASDGMEQTVFAYLEDDGSGKGTYKLTIAGNGYGCIYTNADSYRAFRNFTQVKSINGATVLNTSKTTTMCSMFNSCQSLTTIDLSSFDTALVTDMSYMFLDCASMTAINVDNFNTSAVTDMSSMFKGCEKLLSMNNIDTRTVSANGKSYTAWNMSSVKDLSNMFDSCDAMKTLDTENWELSSAETTRGMFQDCSDLENVDVSKWAFSTSLIDTSFMFNNCGSLQALALGGWVMSKVEETQFMFNECTTLITLPVDSWNVSSVKNMEGMFEQCYNLTTMNVGNWQTSSATNMKHMFYECESIVTLAVSNWDVDQVTKMDAMFYQCGDLSTLDVSDWTTTALTTVTGSSASVSDGVSYYWDEGMFEGCTSLETIDISGWDMSKIKNNAHMFYDCAALNSLTIPASAAIISPEFAYNCTALTSITFLHPAGASITLPTAGAQSAEKLTTAGPNGEYSDGGAFYVPSYLKTTITGNNNISSPSVYDWITDNRMKVGITRATLAYNDVRVGATVPAQLGILPADTAPYESIKYEVTAGGTYATVNASTGVVAGKAVGTATVKVTIVDANGKTVTATGTVKVYQPTPILAAQDTWYTQGKTSITKSSITKISFVDQVDSATKTAAGTNCWDASDAKDGSVYAYAVLNSDGTTYSLTIAGNGSGKIYANPDSTKAFSGDATYFTNAASFQNIALLDTSKVTTMNHMFSHNDVLTTLDLSTFDTDLVTDMTGMFAGCLKLTDLNVSSFNTSNVEDMYGMFWNCESIVTIDLSSFNTQKVRDMSEMFANCKKLTTPIISSFNTSNVTDMHNMFIQCYVLANLDVRHFDTAKVTNTQRMFDNCKALQSIDISGWNMAKVTSNKEMFWNCNALTSLTLPASLTTICDSFAAGCEKLTTINFLHTPGTVITFPTAGETTGAFHVANYLETTFSFNGNSYAESYDWVTDNRARVLPMLAAQNTWYTQGEPTIDKQKITSVTIKNTGAPSTFVDSWDASEGEVGSVTAYLQDDGSGNGTYKLTLVGNGTGKIYANPDSSYAFKWFKAMTAFNGAELLDMSKVTKMGSANAQSGMFTGCEVLTSINVSNWDVSNVTRMCSAFDNCHALQTLNVSSWDVGSVTDFSYMFSSCYALTTLDVSKWDVSSGSTFYSMFYDMTNVTALDVSKWNMSHAGTLGQMFCGCETITSLNVTNWDTSYVNSMYSVFNGCKNLTTIGSVTNWKTGNVNNMEQLFAGCAKLNGLDVSKWDVKKVKTMEDAFRGCSALTALDVSSWTTSALQNLDCTFRSCTALTTLNVSNWDTADVTDMEGTFMYCSGLKTIPVQNWSTANVTTMAGMFLGCTALTSLDLSNWNTANVTALGKSSNYCGIFTDCTALTSLKVSTWNTSKVTDMSYLFEGCSALGTLDLRNWNTGAVTNMKYAFDGMKKLATVTLGANFKFVGDNGYLPTPNGASGYLNNSSVTGKWYNTTTLVGYTPAALAASHSGLVTYSAYNPQASVLSLAFDPATNTITGYDASN